MLKMTNENNNNVNDMDSVVDNYSENTGQRIAPRSVERVFVGSSDISNFDSIKNLKLEHINVPLNKLKMEFKGNTDPSKFKTNKERDAKTLLHLPDGRVMSVGSKFYESFSNLTSLGRSVFNYFSPDEVFERVAKHSKDVVRITTEGFKNAEASSTLHGKVLTFSGLNKPTMLPGDVVDLAERYDGVRPSYHDGLVSVSFPCPFPMNMSIVGKSDSDFTTRFTVDFNLDCFGAPAAYLELLRKVCSNGMVARTKAFRTEFSLGKDDSNISAVLNRAIGSFNSEEGYHAYRDRMTAATRSWASLGNYLTLSKSIFRGCAANGFGIKERREIIERLDKITEAPMHMYSFIAGGAISPRTAKVLAINCTVYDLINFATEVATHKFTNLTAKNYLYGWLGDIIVSEYDLENTRDKFADFKDICFDHLAPKIKQDNTVMGN